MRIESLHTYPVKGSHRLDHHEAQVEPWGLAGDRRWMIVDADGVGLTQRDHAALTALHPVVTPGGLTLRAPGHPDLHVPEPADGPALQARVFTHKPPVPVRRADPAGAWVTALLGRPAHLVWQQDPGGRPIPASTHDGDRVNLADGYPLLATTTASLGALNDWLAGAGAGPVPMTRFRPNVVIDGATPWTEDGWPGGRLRLGAAVVRAARACNRCVVTTIDQETGERGRQPLAALGRHRRIAGGLPFGVLLVPDRTAILRVGDPVTPLS
ncbi:MOSC domain-containing protein [Jidongwangia harbinensis]|uniref:MOSC domain-containing protein n=1 Tax=Jidongwangia harbinensis TaxID=2878561 RepID=UPI001CD9F999|nr:MOSC N-terminal beta barrel domain-containing protein [Jidongwangia harbinensis]MCA2215429.1 MOSC domain-containing protein [Jidongwangia harbinensis]